MMCGGALFAANPEHVVECRCGACDRQGQGDSIDWSLGQERRPLTVCMRGVLRMDGGSAVAQAHIEALVGQAIGRLRWCLRPRRLFGFVLRATG